MPDEETVTETTKAWETILSRHCKKAINDLKREYPLSKTLIINYGDVERSGKSGLIIADGIINNPGKVIEDCIDAAANLRIITNARNEPVKDIVPRFSGLHKKTPIKSLRERHINTLLAIEVQVKRISDILPRCTEGVFRCSAGHFTKKRQPFMKFVIPEQCGTDGCTRKALSLMPKRSTFTDTQRISVQEIVDNLHGGEQPLTMNAEVTGDLVGKIFPGDRIIINAILRSYQVIRAGDPSPVFKMFLEVNNIEIFEREYEEINISDEDEQQILALAKMPNILQKVSGSIVPFIHGLDDVKQAVALSMFSGKQVVKEGNTKRRDIHIMLCFDPSMAKTKIGRAIIRVVPRGIFVSGESASKAGLTVTFTHDEVDKRWGAEAGAMCLADGGVMVLDEMGKLPKPERGALYESMENQTTSFAKAGIIGSYHTRCAVITLTTPKFGRFDPQGDLDEQLDTDPALLTRSDLIFIKMDVPESSFDAAVADKILEDDDIPEGTLNPDVIPLDLLRKFIAYSKKQPNPKLSKEAKTLLKSHYVDVRSRAQPEKPMPVTPRALESSQRIAIAHAKMRLSDTVTEDDARLAITLLDACLKNVATDPQSGLLDADRLGGVSKRKRDLATTILETIKELHKEQGAVRMGDIVSALRTKSVQYSDRDIETTIEQLLRNGSLMEPKNGVFQVV